jgi:hypothetical protein
MDYPNRIQALRTAIRHDCTSSHAWWTDTANSQASEYLVQCKLKLLLGTVNKGTGASLHPEEDYRPSYWSAVRSRLDHIQYRRENYRNYSAMRFFLKLSAHFLPVT